MNELEKELADLDRQLKTNTVRTSTRKIKTIDDFLADNKNENNNSKSKDFLADNTDVSSKKSNNGDFLADITNKNSNSNDFLSDIDKKEDKNSFEIKRKDNKQGVIDKNGKVLIPFKDWRIREYKMGIALVEILLESFSCTNCINEYLENEGLYDSYMGASAYKVGYVDKTGEFIDGYETRIYEDCEISFSLRLYSAELSEEDIERIQERMVLEREKAEKKCQMQTAAWRSQMISKYQN